jgi:ABC-type transport system involved in multi-copper enzyme maturation permease subunit
MTGVDAILGPLGGVEVVRAASRSWLFKFRFFTAIPSLIVLLIAVWLWTLADYVTPGYLPGTLLRVTMGALLMVSIGVAVVLSPAVLAGTLAEEKLRGTLGILLISRISDYEIVAARFAGKLLAAGFMVAATLPPLFLAGGLCGFDLSSMAALAALPLAVTFGTGGAAFAASAVCQRGRDALVMAYVLVMLIVALPSLVLLLPTPGPLARLTYLNPFVAIGELAGSQDPRGAWISSALWLLVGAGGLAATVWRLRPSYLKLFGGDQRAQLRRCGRVPAVSEHPMLWKELYVERMRSFGRVGRFVGWLVGIGLLGGTAFLVGCIEWHRWVAPNDLLRDWAEAALFRLINPQISMVLSWLIQWAIGLRAATTVVSERERSNWDALLLTPLEGEEILRAKVWGSLYGLRWFMASMVLLWTVGLIYGAMQPAEYWWLLASCAVGSFFMSSAGVWTSMILTTSNRSMITAMLIWLGRFVVFGSLGAAVMFVYVLGALYVWMYLVSMGRAALAGGPAMPVDPRAVLNVTWLVIEAATAVALTWFSRVLFDRVSGRTVIRWVRYSTDATAPATANQEPADTGPSRAPHAAEAAT